MSHSIMFCRNCNRYTMKEICPECSQATAKPRPPKYSPEDKYAKYRRKYKETHLENV